MDIAGAILTAVIVLAVFLFVATAGLLRTARREVEELLREIKEVEVLMQLLPAVVSLNTRSFLERARSYHQKALTELAAGRIKPAIDECRRGRKEIAQARLLTESDLSGRSGTRSDSTHSTE